MTVVEGLSSSPYKTATLSVPSGATILLDGKTSTLGALAAGDHVVVSSSSDGTTTVFATDSSFSPPQGAHGGPGGGVAAADRRRAIVLLDEHVDDLDEQPVDLAQPTLHAGPARATTPGPVANDPVAGSQSLFGGRSQESPSGPRCDPGGMHLLPDLRGLAMTPTDARSAAHPPSAPDHPSRRARRRASWRRRGAGAGRASCASGCAARGSSAAARSPSCWSCSSRCGASSTSAS